MTSDVQSIVQAHTKSAVPVLIQNIATLMFGATIIFAVGFLPVEAAHNAAHDTRHSLSFPCH